MSFLNSLIIFLIAACTVSCLYSQEKYELKISSEDDRPVKYRMQFNDSVSVLDEVEEIWSDCRRSGYVLASVDSISWNGRMATAFLFIGNRYSWGTFSFDSIDDDLLRRANIREKNYHGNFRTGRFVGMINKLLSYCENTGYPFCRVSIESPEIKGDSISGSIRLDLNKYIRIDSIIIKGKATINPVFIYNYLDIYPGDAYSEKKLAASGTRLDEIAFVKQIRPSSVVFHPDHTSLFLFIDRSKANQFNGILGLAPNNRTTGKLLLTGDVNLSLINSFGYGEVLSLRWKKLETASQSLNIRGTVPFIMKLPIGLDGTFDLLKKDSTYINVTSEAGILFLMPGGNSVRGFIGSKTSSLISTTGLASATVLPDYADINTLLYGMGISYEKLDYRYNPRKGFSILFNAGYGTKKIKKNIHVNPDLYNEIDLSAHQLESRLTAALFIPLVPKTAIKIRSVSGFMESSTLFENEMFRLGGLTTMRGLDEESVTASAFSVLSLEFRFLFEKNSCLYLFTDGCYYEKRLKKNTIDRPVGFGVGLDFETKAGIFTINYAIAKQFDNTVELKSAKIHFGFINRF
ncbi:MAG: BamA/TamA family outer membrane protein [Bacteroidota bacterium]